MAFGALSMCLEKSITNAHFCVLWQVLREAVADSVVEEDAGVAEATEEAEVVRGVDVRDPRFQPDFHSYGLWGQAGVCNHAAEAALSVVDADAAGPVVEVANTMDAAGPGEVRRLSSSRTSTRGSLSLKARSPCSSQKISSRASP